MVDRYKGDIITLAEHCFILPETRKPVKLLAWQKHIFQDLFDKPEAERPTLALLGQPKKSGKSTLAAIVGLFYLVNKSMGECYILGPDKDQGSLVIFNKLVTACRMHPTLYKECKITGDCIEHKKTGCTIRVLPCSKTSAGLSPDLLLLDELWQFDTTESKRTIDELTTIPQKHMLTLITTYAGYQDSEDTHLYQWYKQGVDMQEGVIDPDPKFYFLWRTNYDDVPWVTQEYLDSQKQRLRENTYKRFHENQWVSSEEAFISADVVDACTNPDAVRGVCEAVEKPSVCIGIDAGLKHDASAVAVVRAIDGQTLGVCDHAVFVPRSGQTLDLEKTVESILRVYQKTYDIRAVYYDPFQFARSAKTLQNEGLPMREYCQTVNNTVAMSETLNGLLNNQTLMLYPDDELRQHLLNCMAKETQRGWRIVKQRQSQKIDLAVALAMACQAAQETYLLRTPCSLEIIDPYDDLDDENDYWQEVCTLSLW